MLRFAPVLLIAFAAGCAPFVMPTQEGGFHASYPDLKIVPTGEKVSPNAKREQAIFACGCFWGSEARLREVPGVLGSAVGYIGGHKDKPTYKEICYTDTGHAEAVLVEFDPAKVSYRKLVDLFWEIHNPTTVNRQGPDIGSQYRSAIFYLSEEQRVIAEASKKANQPKFEKPIVTEIVKAPKFWMAEEYHQQYHIKTGTLACPIDTGNRKGGG